MRVWILLPLLAACDPNAGKSDDTGDSGIPAVVYDYFPGDESGFGQRCEAVTVDGLAGVPVDADGDGVIDCGRTDEGGAGLDLTLEAWLDGNLADSHELTAPELNAAVQAVWGKAQNRTTDPVDFGEVCNQVCDAMFQSFRKGNCPEYKGTTVAASENALTVAMNSVDSSLAGSLGVSMDGAWCWVSTRPADLLPSTTFVQSPVNIWWGVIYGLRNYSAGSVVYQPDGAPVAVYGVTYKVPGKVANTYSSFLANTMTSAYPAGSSFSLMPVSAKYSTDGATVTSGGWPAWWSSPTGTGVIDPVFDAFGAPDLAALDTFISAHAAGETNIPLAAVDDGDAGCPMSNGFPPDDPTGLAGDPVHNNESIGLDEECPEPP